MGSGRTFTGLLRTLQDTVASNDHIAAKLKDAGAQLRSLLRVFSGPDSASQASLAAAAAAAAPKWLTVPAADQQQAACVLSTLTVCVGATCRRDLPVPSSSPWGRTRTSAGSRQGVNELYALDLLREYVFLKDAAQILGTAPLERGHTVQFPLPTEDLLQALELYYEERLAVLACVATVLRVALAPDHPHYDACSVWVADVVAADPGFTTGVLNALVDVAERRLPVAMVCRRTPRTSCESWCLMLLMRRRLFCFVRFPGGPRGAVGRVGAPEPPRAGGLARGALPGAL